MKRPIKVLVAKVGLDGHDVGAVVVARALRDAGMDVIYTGLRKTPEMVVETAIREGVDMIGISILSGAHMPLMTRVVELLREKNAEHILVLGGGVIPKDDVEKLKSNGVKEIFLAGTPTENIVDFISDPNSCRFHLRRCRKNLYADSQRI